MKRCPECGASHFVVREEMIEYWNLDPSSGVKTDLQVSFPAENYIGTIQCDDCSYAVNSWDDIPDAED